MADENSREGTSVAGLGMNAGPFAQSHDLANVVPENLKRAGFAQEFFDAQLSTTPVMVPRAPSSDIILL
jgi:hypothetical protein